MDLYLPVVLDEAELTEFVHEIIDPRPSRSDPGGQSLLADFRDDGLQLSLLAEIGEKQQYPRQALFAGVEQLIDQICLDLNIACQQE